MKASKDVRDLEPKPIDLEPGVYQIKYRDAIWEFYPLRDGAVILKVIPKKTQEFNQSDKKP